MLVDPLVETQELVDPLVETRELVDPLVDTRKLVDPLVDTRELVDPLVDTPPGGRVFKAARLRIIRVTWGFTVHLPPGPHGIACPLAGNQMFQVGLLFRMFQHSTAMTFFFFSTFLLLQEPMNMLIATKWSGCELQSVKMTDGPQIFPSPFKKNGHWRKNIQLTRPLSESKAYREDKGTNLNADGVIIL